MILGRLFEKLFARGVTVVATTNVAPDELYKDGLNRALFLPFIDLLKEHMAVFHLDAPRDYRLDATGGERRYVTPLGAEAEACLDAHFRHFAGVAKGERRELDHKGRRIVVPETAGGVARFSFDDLCGRPLGAGDYLKIAEALSHPYRRRRYRFSRPRAATRRSGSSTSSTRSTTGAFGSSSRRKRSRSMLCGGKDGAESFEFARTASRLDRDALRFLLARGASASARGASASPETKKAQAVKPGPSE